MVENRPWLTIMAHAVLILGIAVVAFPIYATFIASTHTLETVMRPPLPLLPGHEFLKNYSEAFLHGTVRLGNIPIWRMLLNSAVMALIIAIGKIAISIISAYSIVYFRFPFRMVFFWLIFITLMLPVEVRIVPTFKVVSDLGLLDNFAGLTIPLIASATATFLFRQFFLTVPEELLEAARIDGAGPMRFFKDILLPLSLTNIAALFVILFIYGWNQYLWPLLVTTKPDMKTIVVGLKSMISFTDADTQWHLVMATTILAMLPPILVVILMQRLFVKGLIETEK
ncbi:MAG: sn-glycerol-3-phosphate ABC transporter permease UgpE [Alphaproteobacteria bacterium]